MLYLNVYILLINIISFIFMRMDKQSAQKRKRRISEKTLFAFALFGGSIGILLGMWIFNHKTRHLMFILLIPFLTVSQVLLYFYLQTSVK